MVGMRRSEVARLKIADIDSHGMVSHVVNGKGGKDRDLPLSPTLLEAPRAQWRWLKPQAYLFPSRMHRDHEQPKPLRTLFSFLCGKAGIRITFGGVACTPRRNIHLSAANSRFTVALLASSCCLLST
jgi:integrase